MVGCPRQQPATDRGPTTVGGTSRPTRPTAHTQTSTWTLDPNTTLNTETANRASSAPAPKRAGSTEPSGRRIRLRRRPKPLLPDPSGPDEPQKRSRPRLRKLRFAFVILGLTALALVSWIFGIMMAVAQDLPVLESREQYKQSENSIVYDAYGQKLATLTNNQGRMLESGEIAPVMKEAVVAIEDQRFYEHSGVDFQGIARAVWQDVTLGLRPAGRLDDHPAVRQERARRPGQPDRVPEAPRGGARLSPRAPVAEGQDPHRVPERDLLRRGRDGDRGRRAHLLRLQPPRLRRERRPVRLAAAARGRPRCSRG